MLIIHGTGVDLSKRTMSQILIAWIMQQQRARKIKQKEAAVYYKR
jgi:hypothetical protein